MAQFLAPTDSRFRKDIQLLEQGKFKEAESEMQKIFEKQKNQVAAPKYFKLEESHFVPITPDDCSYWEKRITGDWNDAEIIKWNKLFN